MFKHPVFNKIVDDFKRIESKDRATLLNFGFALFFALFSYPLIRSTTTAMFLDSYGAQNSPLVWFYSVIVLAIVVFIYNKFQTHSNIQQLYLFTSLFSVVFFLLGIAFFLNGGKLWAYYLFIWKEVYIVLLVHMIFGHVNASIPLDLAKTLFGPLGALGSLGGVLGGIATSYLSFYFKTETILGVGTLLIILSALCFQRTKLSLFITASETDENSSTKKLAPLVSIKGVAKYVFLLGGVIALSQFIINLANFKFDVLFSSLVPDKELKTRYLGYLYTVVNVMGLFIQIILVPICLNKFRRRTVHLFIPSFYLILALGGLILGGGQLILLGLTFALLKGIDYSLFSAAKEIMYIPLNFKQKYGAKYVNDMVIYRFAKGLISFFLIYFQSLVVIDSLLIVFLILWIMLVFPLFRESQRLMM